MNRYHFHNKEECAKGSLLASRTAQWPSASRPSGPPLRMAHGLCAAGLCSAQRGGHGQRVHSEKRFRGGRPWTAQAADCRSSQELGTEIGGRSSGRADPGTARHRAGAHWHVHASACRDIHAHIHTRVHACARTHTHWLKVLRVKDYTIFFTIKIMPPF